MSYHLDNKNHSKPSNPYKLNYIATGRDVGRIYKENWSYELEQFIFEGVAGMQALIYEIGIFHV